MKKHTHKLTTMISVLWVLGIFFICSQSIFAQSESILPEGVNLESRVPIGTIPMSSKDLTQNLDFTGNVSVPIPLFSLGGFDIQLKYYNRIWRGYFYCNIYNIVSER